MNGKQVHPFGIIGYFPAHQRMHGKASFGGNKRLDSIKRFPAADMFKNAGIADKGVTAFNQLRFRKSVRG